MGKKILFVSRSDRPAFSRLPSVAKCTDAKVTILCNHDDVIDHTHHFDKKLYWYGTRRFGPSVWRLSSLFKLLLTLISVRPDILIFGDESSIKLSFTLQFVFGGLLQILSPKTALTLRRALPAVRTYDCYMKRWENHTLVETLGLPCPEARNIASRTDALAFLVATDGPIVLKADDTVAGLGVWICADRQDIDKAFAQITPDQLPMIGQRHIKGILSFYAFAAYRGKLLSGLGSSKLEGHMGETGPSSVIRIFDSADMVSAAQALAAALNLTGLFGIDFLLDEDSGQHKIIEFNPRPTQTSHLGTMFLDLLGAQGVTIPEALKAHPLQSGAKVALYPQEWIRQRGEVKDFGVILDKPVSDPGLISAFDALWQTLPGHGQVESPQ